MNLDFKKVAAVVFLLGIGYAWYSGMLDGFLDGFGGQLGQGGKAAMEVEE